MKTILVLLAVGWLIGCGVIGPPIPPEDVGVERTIQRQKQQEELEGKGHEAGVPPVAEEPEAPEVVLPPLRPVGTR